MALQLPSSISPGTAAAISAIDSAYNSANLRRALELYPGRIAEQKQQVNLARKERTDVEMERATAEAEMRLAILAETDERGKARWSNVEARDAELIRRKGTDSEYRDKLDALYKAEAALQEEQDILTMLQEQFQSARIAGRLIAAEMAAFSAIIDVGEMSEVTASGALADEFGGAEVSAAVGAEKIRKFAPQKSKEERQAF